MAFSSGQPLIRELSTRLNAAGIGYFKFNNRGPDVVAGRGKHLARAAFEQFGRRRRSLGSLAARGGWATAACPADPSLKPGTTARVNGAKARVSIAIAL